MVSRLIIIILIFQNLSYSLSLRDFDKSPKSHYHLANVIRQVKLRDLHKNLANFLKVSRPSRAVNSLGHQKAREFIISRIKEVTGINGVVNVVPFKPNVDNAIRLYEDSLKELSKNVTKESDKLPKEFLSLFHFTESMTKSLKQLKGLKGKNIVWEKIGSQYPNDFIIIGAHYDTLGINFNTGKIDLSINQPGADNNGSGVSILISLIELFSELNIKKSVRVVFFDYGEFGALGEYDYARIVSQESKSGIKFNSFVRLTMLGHDSKIKDKEKKYGNYNVFTSQPGSSLLAIEKGLVKEFDTVAKRLTYSIKFKEVEKSFSLTIPDAFKEQSIPSLTYTQNWESDFNKDRIHSSKDFLESVNIQSLFNSYQYLAMALSYHLLDL